MNQLHCKRRYAVFCMESNLPQLLLQEHILCLFAAHLATSGLKPINGYLSGLLHLQISAGLSDPFKVG